MCIDFINCFFLISCDNGINSASCKDNVVIGTAVLVGYKVSKHSRLYVFDPETHKIHTLHSLGGRREPSLKIGESFDVQYCGLNKEYLYIDRDRLRTTYVRVPEDKKSRTVMLPGYNL